MRHTARLQQGRMLLWKPPVLFSWPLYFPGKVLGWEWAEEQFRVIVSGGKKTQNSECKGALGWWGLLVSFVLCSGRRWRVAAYSAWGYVSQSLLREWAIPVPRCQSLGPCESVTELVVASQWLCTKVGMRRPVKLHSMKERSWQQEKC